MKGANKLSVVIITKNEEENIGNCLKSIKEIADEIVVVDSFSNDNTEKICQTFQVVFIQNKFEGHIQQKNFALDQASYDYVLSLDADEMLSSDLRNAISEIKNQYLHDAYEFNRLTNYCGKWIHHSGWYPDRKIRLWNKNKGRWGGINPHDKVIMNEDATVKRIKKDILHYSIKSIDQHLQVINTFSTIAAKEKFRMNKKPSFYKMHLNPSWKFVKRYFFNLGFLDGYSGYLICRLSAFSTFLKYAKLKQLHKEAKSSK